MREFHTTRNAVVKLKKKKLMNKPFDFSVERKMPRKFITQC